MIESSRGHGPLRRNSYDWLRRTISNNWLDEFGRIGIDIFGKRILDAGCGAGSYGSLLGKSGAVVFGLDIDSDCIREASSKANLTVVRGSLVSLPYCTCTFDIVLLRYALHQVPRPYRSTALCEVARVLAPGGFLVLESTTPELASMNHDFRLYPRLLDAVKEVYPSDSEVDRWLTGADLQILRRLVTVQDRGEYTNIEQALDRSTLLVTEGKGPTPWLGLSLRERREFHKVRASGLREMYGTGPVPRRWWGQFLVAQKEASQ